MDIQPLPKTGCKYGAPMGRHGDNPDPDFAGEIVCEPILDPCPSACGAYDYEGAYWGAGIMVWRCICEEKDDTWVIFRRARDIKAECLKEMPDAKTLTVLERPIGEHCGADFEEGPCEWCLECEESE